jgi:UDP-2,3-diacylglucosamine pyrophosphatase LpxH
VLIFVSDLHLRTGGRLNLSRAAQFQRFWQRIESSRRGGKARLCIVGDLFDLVRTPDWFQGALRPYSDPSPELEAAIEATIQKTLELERPFLSQLKAKVTAGELEVHYLVGNHDRLLDFSPGARRRIRDAFGMSGGDAPFPLELRFPEEGVLAYHGHTVDDLSHDASRGPSFADLFCPELIVRFPIALRERLDFDHPHLDDIDDVRPVLAVPTWVHTLAKSAKKGEGKDINRVWAELVAEFLDNSTVKSWFKDNHKRFRFDFPAKMKLLLSLSAKRGIQYEPKFLATHDLMFRVLDVKFAKGAYDALSKKENKGLRYVVNGHTHFGAMTPLGVVNGQQACYFNLGTWRTVHQLGNVNREEPGFLAWDAMGYLAFFPKDDALGREYEWWQGAAVARGA